MSKRPRRRHSAEQKAEALKRHHLQKQDVSTICEDRTVMQSIWAGALIRA
jgi:transposase-like protein